MDKRILPLAFVCGLLSTPAFAQLTTIGPNTPGVSEFDVTMVQKGPAVCMGDVGPIPCFFPSLTAIHPLQSGGGGLDFGNLAADNNGCFQGCGVPFLGSGPASPGDITSLFKVFAVSFQTQKPVTTVVALQMPAFPMSCPSLSCETPAEVLAFDGQQIVSTCIVVAPGGCYSDTHLVQTTPGGIPAEYIGNLTVSAPEITSVWIAAGNFGSAQVAMDVQFGTSSVPEPGTFALFAIALACLAVTRRRASMDLPPRTKCSIKIRAK